LNLRNPLHSLAALIAALVITCSLPAQAEEAGPVETVDNPWSIDGWSIQTSIYTKHFDPEPDHVNDQNLIGVEAHFRNQWLGGLAVFDNSFGQPSQFLYMGRSWRLFGSEYWHFKLMGGLLHGYKEPYEDKIPLNQLGVAPAIVPALGFRYKWFIAEANLGGLAVVTVTAGVRF
jgi:hypothetical protein